MLEDIHFCGTRLTLVGVGDECPDCGRMVLPLGIRGLAVYPDGSSHWQDDPGKWENCGPCGTWGDRDYGPNARTNTPGVI